MADFTTLVEGIRCVSDDVNHVSEGLDLFAHNIREIFGELREELLLLKDKIVAPPSSPPVKTQPAATATAMATLSSPATTTSSNLLARTISTVDSVEDSYKIHTSSLHLPHHHFYGFLTDDRGSIFSSNITCAANPRSTISGNAFSSKGVVPDSNHHIESVGGIYTNNTALLQQPRTQGPQSSPAEAATRHPTRRADPCVPLPAPSLARPQASLPAPPLTRPRASMPAPPLAHPWADPPAMPWSR